MTANLPMGGNKITGGADPTVATDFATKNYVDTTTASFFSTGDVKLTLKSTADSGWYLFDDTTFGSASSGATHADNASQALFTLLFNSPFTDTTAPILTSGGGATTRAAQVSASAAWAANCRMSLPKTLGRALAIAGTGSGLTARTLGATVGEETHLLTQTELPNVTVPVSGSFTGSATINGNTGNIPHGSISTSGAQGGSTFTGLGISGGLTLGGDLSGSVSGSFSTNSNFLGSGGAHNNMQPTSFMNAMVKL